VRADHSAGAFAVDVQVADVKGVFGFFDPVAVPGPHRAGEAVFSGIGDGQSLVEMFRLDHRQHRSKDLLLIQAGAGLDVGKDGGLYKIAVARGLGAAG